MIEDTVWCKECLEKFIFFTHVEEGGKMEGGREGGMERERERAQKEISDSKKY